MASRPVLESISADRKSRVKELDLLARSKHIFQLQLFCVIIGCCVCDVTSKRRVSEICYFLESLFIESAKALLYIQAVLLQIEVSPDKVHSVFGPIYDKQHNEFNGHLKFGELITAVCDNLSDKHFKSLRFILKDKYKNEVHEENIPCAKYLFMLLIDKNVINFKNMSPIASALRVLDLESLAGKIDAYLGTVAVSQQGSTLPIYVQKLKPGKPTVIPLISGSRTLHVSHEMVCKQINYRMLTEEFAGFVTNLGSHLKHNSVPVDDVKTFVKLYCTAWAIPDPEKFSSRKCMDEITRMLDEPCDISQLFTVVTRENLWDKFSFCFGNSTVSSRRGLLEAVIKKFANKNKEVHRDLQQYKKAFSSYTIGTTIAKYVAEVESVTLEDKSRFNPYKRNQKYKNILSKFKVKLRKEGVTVHNTSLHYITELWNSIADELRADIWVATVDKIKEGCIAVTWLIPSYWRSHIMSRVPECKEFYVANGIVRVKLDGLVLYDSGHNSQDIKITLHDSDSDSDDGSPESATVRPNLEGRQTTARDLVEGNAKESTSVPFMGIIPSPVQQAGTDKNKEAVVETIPDNTSLMDFTSQKDLAETALDKVVPDDDQNIIVVNESNVVKQACSFQAASGKEKSPDESLPNQDISASKEPETLSDKEQSKITALMLRKQYSDLYHQVDPKALLPKLPEKFNFDIDRMHGVLRYDNHPYAQTAEIIATMFFVEQPLAGLHKLCEILNTAGLKQFADILMEDYRRTIDERRGTLPSPIAESSTESDFSGLEMEYENVFENFTTSLDDSDASLKAFRQLFASLAMPLGHGKVACLVSPDLYEKADTSKQLMHQLKPLFNCLSIHLFHLVVQKLGNNASKPEIAQLMENRRCKHRSVLCSSSGQTRSSDAAQEYPANEHLLNTTTLLSVEVDLHHVCLSQYDNIVTALCGFYQLPNSAVVYVGSSRSPLSLNWRISKEIHEYLKVRKTGLSGHWLLRNAHIARISIGEDFSFKCPTKQELDMVSAAFYGWTEKLQEQMGKVNVNTKLYDGWTALIKASKYGHLKAVQILLSEKEIDIDVQDKDGMTALHEACHSGKEPEIVETLLKNGANRMFLNKEECTPLHLACKNGHYQVVRLLSEFEHSSDEDDSRYLKFLDSVNRDGDTALMVACANGSVEIVNSLIGVGADPSYQNAQDGFSALHFASYMGRGETPLMLATVECHAQVIELLLHANANPNIETKDDVTALQIAFRNGEQRLIDLLNQAVYTYT